MSSRAAHFLPDESQPIQEMTVGRLLREAAAEAPGAVALVDGSEAGGGRRWTYAEVLERAEAIALRLVQDLSPGDRLAIWGQTSPEWLMTWYGAALAGVTLVTVNPGYRAGELRYVLSQSEATALALDREFRGARLPDLLEDVRPDLPGLVWTFDLRELAGSPRRGGSLPHVSPDAVAQIQYTSGTTGFPKGAMLHHLGITNNIRFYAQRLGMGTGEVYLSPMPLFHVGGSVTSALSVLWTRSTLVTVDRFDAGRMLQLMEAERATVTIGVPTMLIDILEHPEFRPDRVRSMRQIMCGGAYTPAALVGRLSESFGATIHNSFGQTECGPIMTMTGPEDEFVDIAETAGFPMPQIELRVVDIATGATAACGQPGELCARGYQVMKGYHGMEDATAAAIDAGGWLHTGDICSMDERGYVRIAGRLKEMVIRGGENIFPKEIEDVLGDHPAVAAAAVVGLPDPRLGEAVGAFVKLVPGASADAAELREFAAARLAREKVPAHWTFVEEFPLTANGKVMKHRLREAHRRR